MKKASGKLSVGFLFDDTLDSNDGVAQYVKAVGAWLSGSGHKVIYLVGDSKTKNWAGGEVYSLSKNLRFAWGGNRLSMPLLARQDVIKRTLEEHKLDVVHVQVPYSPFMAQRVINRIEPSVAVVGTFHVFPANSLVAFGSKLLRMVYGKSLKRFDAQLSVSTAAQSYARGAFGITSSIIPNVVDQKKLSVKNAVVKPTYPHIVFLGRLVSRKGAAQLLEAFRVLRQRLPEARLTIAGDGPERTKLEKFVRKNNLQCSVNFMGFIKEADKAALLASADIACFPSLYGESFGIVLIEAMAAGAGVVLGGNNQGYQTVLGQKPVLLIDPKNKVEFSGRMEKLLVDKKLAQDLHNWQNLHVKQYDIALVGPKLVDVYRLAIASRHQKT